MAKARVAEVSPAALPKYPGTGRLAMAPMMVGRLMQTGKVLQ